jgi:hypothetical protein
VRQIVAAVSTPTMPAKNADSTTGKKLGFGVPDSDTEERSRWPRPMRVPAVRSEIFVVAARSFFAEGKPWR